MATGTSPLANAVIFSAKDGVVWAYLPNAIEPVALDNIETVTYMMQDFLAQCELGERLIQSQQSNGSAHRLTCR